MSVGETGGGDESTPVGERRSGGGALALGEVGQRRLWLAVYVVIVVASAWHFSEMRFRFNVEYRAQAPVQQLLAYTADRPFQYRVLMPVLINAVPDFLIDRVKPRLFAFEFLATMGVILVFRQWLRRFFDNGAPGLHYNFVFPRNTPIWFPSDIPSVFFFTLGLVLIHEKRWTLFYPLFILATLNRETSCFLTIVYFLAYLQEYRTRDFWIHLLGQTGLWFAIKVGLFLRFQDNGGQLVYHHLDENLSFLVTPSAWPTLLSSLGFTGVIAIAGFPYLKDPFVRRAMLVIIPFGLGMFLVGRIIEMRIYGELIPITLCATILIIASMGHSGEVSTRTGD